MLYFRLGSDAISLNLPTSNITLTGCQDNQKIDLETHIKRVFRDFGGNSISDIPQTCSSHPPDDVAKRWNIRMIGRGYHLYCDDQLISVSCSPDEVALHLEYAFLRHLISRSTELIIHAAVFSKDDTTVMLVGESGVGKTTISMVLMAHGFTYLSDECVVFSGNLRRALPRSFVLEERSIYLLGRYRYDRLVRYAPINDTVGYYYTFPSDVSDAMKPNESKVSPINWIVFPQHGCVSYVRVKSVESAFAYAKLYDNMMSPFTWDNHHLLMSLLKGARYIAIESPNPVRTAHYLMRNWACFKAS